jgi:hypothetical protein
MDKTQSRCAKPSFLSKIAPNNEEESPVETQTPYPNVKGKAGAIGRRTDSGMA